jgi:hypothetical protein
MGFTIVNACYPMSVDGRLGREELSPVYMATSDEDLVRYTTAEKACLFRALLATIGEFRSKIRLFSPRSSVYALVRHYGEEDNRAYPCLGGIDFFFIDSKDGCAYPCGYRGNENLGQLWRWDGMPPRGPICRRCDWECFRDPSELVGPPLQGLRDPLGLWKRIRSDRLHFHYWIDDLKYYRACGLFDGRRPPRMARLRPFEDQTSSREHEDFERIPTPRAPLSARSHAE